MNWHDLKLRWRALMSQKRVERDLEDELDFHIEMQARKNALEGMSEAEAIRRARIQFGGADQVKEECRDARGVGLIETTWRDVCYALRGFRRSPNFALTVVATIALGLGVITALFTVLNAFYLRPIAVHEPHSLYEIFWMDRSGVGHDFTWPEYLEFLKENPALSEALAYRRAEARLNGRHLSGILVTAEYFRMLGVGTAMGRTLLPEDYSAPGREPFIVLSYSAWKNQFAGSPDIVGKKILLRGYPFEVVGVAPWGFNGLGERPTDFWAPLTMSARFDNGPDLFGPERPGALGIVGRLKAGLSVRQARAGVTVWAQRLTANRPNAEKAGVAIFVSRATAKPFNPKNATIFSIVLAAFTVVLLIGCTNVANLMLSRAVARQREIGIRLSLGASRSRLIRQLLTESILLALPAAAVGFILSRVIIGLCIRVMVTTVPPGIAAGVLARIPWLPLDLRVFGFGLAAALLSALCFGLAPAVQATRTHVMQAARGDFTSQFRPTRLRNALVIGQITVCVLLLTTAAILLRGIQRIRIMDSGLSARDNIEMVVKEKFRARVLERLSTDPAVQILAAAANAPVDRKSIGPVMPAAGGATLEIASNRVSPEYFTVFEIPIVRGRNFTIEESRTAAPTAIVSESTAQQLWPNQDAVGKTLRVGPEQRVVNVIGIARDEISRWLTTGDEKTLVYFPTTARAPGNKLFVRVHGDVETAQRRLDANLTALDPNALLAIHKLQIQEWVTEDAYSFQIAYWTSSAIGILALLLTLSGIYAVLSYVVSQRTKEIGIRMAMGATSRAVTGLVLRQSMRLAIIGAIAGGTLAMGMSKILSSVLVMIDTFDVAAYIGGVALVLAACAAAAYFPSRRASRIDPLTTLRYD
jgi:putative ABC transport system permease protein